MDWLFVMLSHLSASPCVCYILILQLVSAHFPHAHHRNYPLMLDSAQSARLLYCVFPSPMSIIFILFHLNFIVFLKFFCSAVWFSPTLPQQFCLIMRWKICQCPSCVPCFQSLYKPWHRCMTICHWRCHQFLDCTYIHNHITHIFLESHN
jgi:hypothetical protein